MSFVDKSIKCSDCGSDFTFSTSEQESFAEKGFTNDHKRCRWCRAAKLLQKEQWLFCLQRLRPAMAAQATDVPRSVR